MRALLTAGALALLVAGCGQKGPLYLPDKNAAVVTSAPAMSPVPPPATAAPAPPPKKSGDQGEDQPPK